ncbi:DMT family transporter [Bacteroidia bacterium]|nr:DMT family transporter [Bacteroidia bacterium]MDC1395082.1 DMT family transporter [Bacteroidia bacterium]
MNSKDNKTAVIYMMLASFIFAMMNLIVKHLGEIPVAQIVLMRSIVMLIMVVAVIKQQKITPFGTHKKLLIFRGVFGSMGIAFFFYTLHTMPLASAVVVHYLTPIFTVLLSVIITRVPLAPLRWFFFLLCFVGIFIIKDFDDRVEVLPLIFGVIGTMVASAAYNVISVLKTKEHHLVIMLYFPMVTVPLCLVYIAISGDWVWTSAFNWFLLSVIGLCTYFAQYFLTRAYQIGEVSKVSIVSYLGIIYALFFGYFLFEEWYSLIVITGLFMVLLGVLGNLFYKGNRG